MKERVTVVLPSLGRDSLLAAINSALDQSLKPEKIVVVDDSSSQSIDFKQFSEVQVLRTGGLRGPAFARNLGLGVVDTEWVAFLDDDDSWQPQHLMNLIEFCRERKLDAAYSSAIVSGKKRPKQIYDGKRDPLVEIYSQKNWRKTKMYLPMPGLLVSREVISHLPFNNNLREREDLWFAHKIYEYQFKLGQSSYPSLLVNQEISRSIGRTTFQSDIEWAQRLELISSDAKKNFLVGIAFRNAIFRRDWRSIVRISAMFPRENIVLLFISKFAK